MNSQPFMIEFINTYFREATRQRRAFLIGHGLVDEAPKAMVNMMDASTIHDLTKGATAAQYRLLCQEVGCRFEQGSPHMTERFSPPDELFQFDLLQTDKVLRSHWLTWGWKHSLNQVTAATTFAYGHGGQGGQVH